MHFVRATKARGVVFQLCARLLAQGVLGVIARPRGATCARRAAAVAWRPAAHRFPSVLAIRRKLADANAGRQGKTLAVNFQFNAHRCKHPAGGVAGAIVNMLAEAWRAQSAQVSH